MQCRRWYRGGIILKDVSLFRFLKPVIYTEELFFRAIKNSLGERIHLRKCIDRLLPCGISRENCVYTAGNPCEAIFQASKQAECLSLLTPRCLKSCPIQDTFSIQFKLSSAPMYILLTRASAQQHTTALSRLKHLPKRPPLFSALIPCIFMVTAAQSDA